MTKWKEQALTTRGALVALDFVLRNIKLMDSVYGTSRGMTVLKGRITEEMARLTSSLGVPDSGPETSKKAAKSMVVTAKSLRGRALRAYHTHGPMTDEEVGDRLGHPRIWPRCSELRSMGLIEPSGKTRVCRRTEQECDVCQITDAGRTVAMEMDK